jgi:hypothetical protein
MQSNSQLGPKLFTINLAHELILNTPAKNTFTKAFKALKPICEKHKSSADAAIWKGIYKPNYSNCPMTKNQKCE